MTTLRVLDLCSGLGGASQAFVDAGDYVVRVDNDPKFKPTVLADVRHFHPKGKWDVILAAPPCNHFSTGNVQVRNPRDPERGMAVVQACRRIIKDHPESVWALENVRGSVKYIGREFGEPTLRSDPWYVWGTSVPDELDLPKKGLRLRQPYWKFHRDGRAYLHRYDQRGGPEVASWPYALSKAVRDLAVRRAEG